MVNDYGRRAFLASLLVEIQEAAAARMPVHPTGNELAADIVGARDEYRVARRGRRSSRPTG
ncbi:hypothetical protein EPN44_14225 [bacterium]|nr:MAG: hypothetical protein EPN44_14225 [bacterium]